MNRRELLKALAAMPTVASMMPELFAEPGGGTPGSVTAFLPAGDGPLYVSRVMAACADGHAPFQILDANGEQIHAGMAMRGLVSVSDYRQMGPPARAALPLRITSPGSVAAVVTLIHGPPDGFRSMADVLDAVSAGTFIQRALVSV